MRKPPSMVFSLLFQLKVSMEVTMSKKFVVSLLSVLLILTFCIALLSPGAVMAAVGLTGEKGGFFEKVETRTLKSIKTGLEDLAYSMGKNKEMNHSSSDKIVTISVKKDSKEIKVEITADGNQLPEFGIKDVNKVIKLAKEYLKPIFNEKESMGLCSLFFSDAYKEYNKGIIRIKLTKEYEGITIECSGNARTGIVNVSLRSTLGVKECLPDKRKAMEMKVSPH